MEERYAKAVLDELQRIGDLLETLVELQEGRVRLVPVLVLMLLTLPAHSKDKHPPRRNWQVGVLEATAEKTEQVGTLAQVVGPPPNVPYAPNVAQGVAQPLYRTWIGYGIHTGTLDYLVRYRVRPTRKSSGRPNVTVHGPIKFAVEGTMLFVLDEDGKEFQMEIMEKRLPAQSKPE